MAMTVDELVELAKEVENNDPIDWGMLSIDEDTTYRLMAANILDLYKEVSEEVALATITKLVVENFVLNLKLLRLENGTNEIS